MHKENIEEICSFSHSIKAKFHCFTFCNDENMQTKMFSLLQIPFDNPFFKAIIDMGIISKTRRE